MSIRIASHLYRNRHGMFYFRLIVPTELRLATQQREFRFSLNTERREEAIIGASHLIVDLPPLMADLQRMADNNETAPKDYFKMWVKEARKTIDLEYRNKALENELYDALQKLREAEQELSASTPRDKAKSVAKAAYDKGQLRGKRETEDRFVFPLPPERTKFFSDLKEAYLSSLTTRVKGGTKKPPTPKTLEEYDRTLQMFITVMEDCRIGQINRKLAGEYFNILRKLPANISRVRAYRGLTIKELVELGAPPQSESNASKKMERISAMFKWALEEKREWGIDANPFVGFGQADDQDTTRRPFTHDELRALLNHPDFSRRKFSTTYAYWLIPLAIYTGARLGELAQLDLKDFIEVDGIPCIDINDTDAVEVVAGERGKEEAREDQERKEIGSDSPGIDPYRPTSIYRDPTRARQDSPFF